MRKKKRPPARPSTTTTPIAIRLPNELLGKIRSLGVLGVKHSTSLGQPIETTCYVPLPAGESLKPFLLEAIQNELDRRFVVRRRVMVQSDGQRVPCS